MIDDKPELKVYKEETGEPPPDTSMDDESFAFSLLQEDGSNSSQSKKESVQSGLGNIIELAFIGEDPLFVLHSFIGERRVELSIQDAVELLTCFAPDDFTRSYGSLKPEKRLTGERQRWIGPHFISSVLQHCCLQKKDEQEVRKVKNCFYAVIEMIDDLSLGLESALNLKNYILNELFDALQRDVIEYRALRIKYHHRG